MPFTVPVAPECLPLSPHSSESPAPAPLSAVSPTLSLGFSEYLDAILPLQSSQPNTPNLGELPAPFPFSSSPSHNLPRPSNPPALLPSGLPPSTQLRPVSSRRPKRQLACPRPSLPRLDMIRYLDLLYWIDTKRPGWEAFTITTPSGNTAFYLDDVFSFWPSACLSPGPLELIHLGVPADEEPIVSPRSLGVYATAMIAKIASSNHGEICQQKQAILPWSPEATVRHVAFPFHVPGHWVAAIISSSGNLRIYNSIACYRTTEAKTTASNIADKITVALANDNLVWLRAIRQWTINLMRCARQEDAVSCGLHAMANVRELMSSNDVSPQRIDKRLSRKRCIDSLFNTICEGISPDDNDVSPEEVLAYIYSRTMSMHTDPTPPTETKIDFGGLPPSAAFPGEFRALQPPQLDLTADIYDHPPVTPNIFNVKINYLLTSLTCVIYGKWLLRLCAGLLLSFLTQVDNHFSHAQP